MNIWYKLDGFIMFINYKVYFSGGGAGASPPPKPPVNDKEVVIRTNVQPNASDSRNIDDGREGRDVVEIQPHEPTDVVEFQQAYGSNQPNESEDKAIGDPSTDRWFI